MVSLGLVGISLPEVGHSVIEPFAPAEIGCDLYAVTGAGVRPGQCPAADPRVQGQLTWRKVLYLHRAFHVPQLTQVVVATDSATKPAEEDVARCLHQPLAGNDPVPLVPVNALRKMRFQHRNLCFLDLEEQRIVLVATLELHDVVPCANASSPLDLPVHVCETVLVQQVTPVLLKGAF